MAQLVANSGTRIRRRMLICVFPITLLGASIHGLEMTDPVFRPTLNTIHTILPWWVTKIILTAPCETCLRAYAKSDGLDQTVHPHSLIGAFTVREQNHWTL